MKSTDKKIAANRRNAAQSTGPRTPAGKAIAARNSLKHGLLAKEIVVDAGEGAESQEQFDALLTDLKGQFEPQGPLEEMLVEKIAVAYWRLRRAHRYEVGLIRNELDTATQDFYEEKTFEGEKEHQSDEQLDSEIEQEKEGIASWQRHKTDLAQMHQDGKPLKSIYDWLPIWQAFGEGLPDRLSDVRVLDPKDLRELLRHRTGWTDDQIWQRLIDACDAQVAQHRRRIAAREREKQDNPLRLEVYKKLRSIPDVQDLDRLLKYEGAIERQFYKAIDQLERLQRLRAGDNVPAPVNIDVHVDGEKAD